MSRKWGGAQGWDSNLRGLQTKYENGTITRAALVGALRRYANQLDAQASRLDGLLDSKAALNRRQAQGLRKQADKLEHGDDNGR